MLLPLLLQGVWAQRSQPGSDSEGDDEGDDEGGSADGSSSSDDEAAGRSSSEEEEHPAGNGHAAEIGSSGDDDNGDDDSDDDAPPEEHSSKQQRQSKQQQQQAFQKQPQPAGKLAAAGAAGAALDDDDGEEGAGLDPERVLLYERSKLRWYYAVVECDGRATASRLYEACDGIEFERSACKFDLRWVDGGCRPGLLGEAVQGGPGAAGLLAVEVACPAGVPTPDCRLVFLCLHVPPLGAVQPCFSSSQLHVFLLPRLQVLSSLPICRFVPEKTDLTQRH
jgi:hypothetical protein